MKPNCLLKYQKSFNLNDTLKQEAIKKSKKAVSVKQQNLRAATLNKKPVGMTPENYKTSH